VAENDYNDDLHPGARAALRLNIGETGRSPRP
jgi:hypothetical protein